MGARGLAARASWHVHPARPLRALALLRQSQDWPPEELRAYQAVALRELLEASSSVPFYRRRLADAGLAPEDVRSVADLAALPPLERSDLQREGIEGLRVGRRRGFLIETSGSTGRPVRVLRPLELVRWVEAADLRAREWHGIGPGEPRLHVGGAPFSPRRRAASALANTLLYYVNRADGARAVARLARSLERRPPALVSGAASCLYVLALVTTLHNKSMPIVRYRIGDLAWAGDGGCPCGRSLPLLGQLAGRANDVLRGRDGSYLTPDRIASHVMTAVAESVVEFQVVQEEDLRVHVRVVQRDSPSPEPRRARIAAELDELLGFPGATTVERVTGLPLTGAGKLRHIVSCAVPREAPG